MTRDNVSSKVNSLFLFVIILILSTCSREILNAVPDPTTTSDAMASPQSVPPVVEEIPITQDSEDVIVLSPPVLLNHYPQYGEVIPPDSSVILEFSKVMDKNSVIHAINVTPESDITLSYLWEDEKTLHLKPSDSGFEEATQYRLYIGKLARAQNGLSLTRDYEILFSTAPDLRVIQTYPDSEVTLDRADFPLQVVFNQPVVSTECVENTLPSESECPVDILTISPPILGKGRWLQDSVYEFVAHKNWTAGQIYFISLVPGIRSLAGTGMTSDADWTFAVNSPEITAVSPPQEAIHVALEESIHVWFSTPMEKEVTSKTLSVRSENGEDIAGYISWQDGGAHLIFTPIRPLLINTTYYVQVGERARAESSTPLDNPATWHFTTFPYPEVVNLAPSSSNAVLRHGEPIRILFSGAIDETSLFDGISVTPVLHSQQMHFDATHNTMLITGELIPQQDYCVTISNSVSDIYGNRLPESIESCFAGGDLPGYFSLLHGMDTQILAVNQPSSLSFENMNTTDVDFTLYELAQIQFVKRDLEQAVDIRQWQETITYSDNKPQINSVSLRRLQGALPTGMYALEWQSDGHELEDVYLAVVDRNIVIKLALDEVLVWVTDQSNGEPVSRTAVSILNGSGDLVAGGTTAEDGSARIPIQNIDNIWEVITAVIGAPGEVGFGVAQTLINSSALPDATRLPFSGGPFAKTMGLVWVDGPVYERGKLVQYYGYIFDRDGLSYKLSNRQEHLEVQLRNEYGMPVYSSHTNVSPTGYFEGSILVDDHINAGSYSLAVYIANKEQIVVNSNLFQIGKYDKHGSVISIQPSIKTMEVYEPLEFYVSLMDNFGNAVPESNFTWSIIAETEFGADEKRNLIALTDQYKWDDSSDLYSTAVISTGVGTTDIHGESLITIPIEFVRSTGIAHLLNHQLWRFRVQYRDGNGDSGEGEALVRMRLNEYHLGLRSNSRIVQSGDRITVKVVTYNREWEPVAGQNVTITLSHVSVDMREVIDATPGLDRISEKSVSVITDELGKADAVFTPKSSGVYLISAEFIAEQGKVSQTVERIWVSGDGPTLPQADHQHLSPITDKYDYQVGDTARILVPISHEGPCYMLFTLERESILYSEILRVEGGHAIIHVPIVEAYAPGVYASFTAIFPVNGIVQNIKTGYVELVVNPPEEQLRVQIVTDQEEYLPGDQALIRIRVTDQLELPIDGEVFVSIQAKEGSNASLSTELSGFLQGKQSLQVASGNSLVFYPDDFQVLENTGSYTYSLYLPVENGAENWTKRIESYPETLLVRSIPHLTSHGEVNLSVQIPPVSDTWQIYVAVTTQDGHFSIGQAEIIVSSAVDLHTKMPSMFVVEDRSTISAILTNLTDINQNVTLALVPVKGIRLEGDDRLDVNLPPYANRRVIWPVYIPLDADSSVSFRIEVSGDGFQYEINPAGDEGIPVLHHSMRTKYTSGLLSDGQQAVDIIHLPELSTGSSTLTLYLEDRIQSLFTSSLEYVLSYPDNTMDVIVARLMTSIINRQHNANQLDQATGEDDHTAVPITPTLELIYAHQNNDGGWGWWQGESNPYITAYTILGILQTYMNGFSVQTDNLNQAVEYLTESISINISQEVKDESLAIGLYIFSLLDLEWPANAASQLYLDRNQITINGKCYLALALGTKDPADTRIETLLNEIKDSAEMSGRGVYWLSADSNFAQSDTLTTALVFYTLLNLDSEFPEKQSIANWLITSRQGTHWSSPLDTAWALTALADYFMKTGVVEPSFDWNVVFNHELLVDSLIKPSTLPEFEQSIRLDNILPPVFLIGENRIEYNRESGFGYLYYSTKLDTASPYTVHQEVSNHGIVIKREYCQVHDGSGIGLGLFMVECIPVKRISKGDVLEVRLTVYLSEERQKLKVVDVYPSGFQPVYEENGAPDGESEPFATRICDKIQCRFFDEVLSQGIYQIVYRLRAINTGEYHILPANINEIYHPEIWAQSDAGIISVFDE